MGQPKIERRVEEIRDFFEDERVIKECFEKAEWQANIVTAPATPASAKLYDLFEDVNDKDLAKKLEMAYTVVKDVGVTFKELMGIICTLKGGKPSTREGYEDAKERYEKNLRAHAENLEKLVTSYDFLTNLQKEQLIDRKGKPLYGDFDEVVLNKLKLLVRTLDMIYEPKKRYELIKHIDANSANLERDYAEKLIRET